MRDGFRPVDRVALCGFSLLAALVVTQDLSWKIRVAAGAALTLLAVGASVTAARGKRRAVSLAALALYSMGVGCFLLSIHQVRTETVQAALTDAPVAVTATVCDLPTYDGRYRYPLKIESLDGKAVSGLRAELVSRKDLSGSLGDVVEGELTVSPCRERSDGTIALAYRTADGVLTFREGTGGGLWMAVCRFRQGLTERLDTMFDGDVRGLVKGVLLGDTSAMSADRINAFRACGLSHTIVVSGMHLTVVSGVFLLLLQLVVRRRRLCEALACLPVLFFLALCGFSPSALRAGVAAFAALLGRAVDEDARCYTSLGWAILLTAVINPAVPASLGFLLSCTAVVGLYGLGQRWQDKLQLRYWHRYRRAMPRPLAAVTGIVFLTLGAQLATLPLMLISFPRVSLVGVPANLAVSWAINGILVFGTLSLLAMSVGLTAVGYALGAAAGLAAKLPLAVVDVLSRFPGITLPAWGGWTALCVAVALVILLISLWRKRLRWGAVGCAAVVTVCLTVNLQGLSATRLMITANGCFLRDGSGVVSVIGFDDAYGGAFDAEKAVSLFGAQRYGVIVWNDFSEWNTCLHKRPAECLVTDEPVDGVLTEERRLTAPLSLTMNGITFDCQETYTLLRCPGTTVVIADRGTSPDDLPDADWIVLPAASPDGTDRVTVVRNGGLASQGQDVYNEDGCEYILTVWENGRTILEKG